MPPHFHVETRPRWGTIITGGVMTAVGAALLVVGFSQRAAASERAHNEPTYEGIPGDSGEFFFVSGGVHAAVGVPLLVYGLLSPREVYVRDSVVRLSAAAPNGRLHVGAELELAF